MDFARDALADGRAFRGFAVADDFTRECAVIAVGTHLASEQVIAVLEQLAGTRAVPTRWSTTMAPNSRVARSMRGPIGGVSGCCSSG